jgi:hypothetical protein
MSLKILGAGYLIQIMQSNVDLTEVMKLAHLCFQPDKHLAPI